MLKYVGIGKTIRVRLNTFSVFYFSPVQWPLCCHHAMNDQLLNLVSTEIN